MIDREKVIKGLEICFSDSYCDDCPYKNICYEDGMMQQLMQDTIALLKEQDNCENCAIAIEDRQPVVRCKDCKHHRKDTCSAEAGMAFPPPDDWFCADGERR